MQAEKDRHLFAPLVLFLWAGYLFFGAYYQMVRQEQFFWISPLFSSFARHFMDGLPLVVSTWVAVGLGVFCAVAGVWMAIQEGDGPGE